MSFKKFAGIAILSGLALLVADSCYKKSNPVKENIVMDEEMEKAKKLDSAYCEKYSLLKSNLAQKHFGENVEIIEDICTINKEYQKLIITSQLPDSIKNRLIKSLKYGLSEFDSLKTLDENCRLEKECSIIEAKINGIDSILEDTLSKDPKLMADYMLWLILRDKE